MFVLFCSIIAILVQFWLIFFAIDMFEVFFQGLSLSLTRVNLKCVVKFPVCYVSLQRSLNQVDGRRTIYRSSVELLWNLSRLSELHLQEDIAIRSDNSLMISESNQLLLSTIDPHLN